MITTVLQGRLGNQFYQISMLLAYCKKHNLPYHIPNIGHHCDGTKAYFDYMATGPELKGMKDYHEQTVHAVPKGDGTYHYNVPQYKDIPSMNNIRFVGYWQSFRYFDWCRDYILDSFNLRNETVKGMIGIHCRYGDFKQLRDKHPEIPADYYKKAVEHFFNMGYRHFFVCSDDIKEATNLIKSINDSIVIVTKENATEIEDWKILSTCEHQILCYSTFGFTAAWVNQNPDKIVIIPEDKYNFGGANADMIPDYFTQLKIQ